MPVRSPVGTALACALAFLAPWGIMSAMLGDPWRTYALALLALLGALLVAAGAWAGRKADKLGLDAEAWTFLAVVTAGVAMLVLMANPRPGPALASLCGECGRLGSVHEPFCFGCGARGA